MLFLLLDGKHIGRSNKSHGCTIKCIDNGCTVSLSVSLSTVRRQAKMANDIIYLYT